MPDGSDLLARPSQANVAADALAGLLAPRKTLPPKLFYDNEGCRLFALITELPEYYVTRTECALLQSIAPELASFIAPKSALIEYGAGNEQKAAILLQELVDPAAYVPIDVAALALEAISMRMRITFPDVAVHPIVADFLAAVRLPSIVRDKPRLGFFPGSTIGNLEPLEAQAFLRRVRRALGAGAHFLVGVDLRKDPRVLIPAYNDEAGVTAAFNLNLLRRLNREADADFDLDVFSHTAIWNDVDGRIEMHLVSLCRQVYHVAGKTIRFEAGETIHTENSYKHTVAGFRDLAVAAGWLPVQLWTDPDDLFSVHLLSTGRS
ncbi:MAG: L-histidine N(alpha)-methyltransferase [Acetobacteraceae bacterium]|nr:L-histidine N(alpha)-methyltransferase [Acetobacteraceae bacterium]